MATTVVTMAQLLEAGAHFGHQTHRWNPRMAPYIFGDRNGVHIIDLSQTVPLFARAIDFTRSTVQAGGKVLFVGTKRQAQDPIAEAARRSGQHFVNHRWLGGMLTNWKTISGSIKRFKALEEQLSGDTAGLTKKEVLKLTRERDKFELSLGGIRDRVVEKRGSRAVADAYLRFLYTPAAQEMAARHFFRPQDTKVAAKHRDRFVKTRFLTINRDFGGWQAAQKRHFADGGVFDQIYTPAR